MWNASIEHNNKLGLNMIKPVFVVSEKSVQPNEDFLCCKWNHNTFHEANDKGADQTVQMYRLICAFVVHLQQSQVFSYQCPVNKPVHEILVLIAYASSKSSYEPCNPHSLTRAFAACTHKEWLYSKTCLKGPLKNRQNQGLNDRW